MKEIIADDKLLLSEKLQKVEQALVEKVAAGERLAKVDRDAVIDLAERGMARREKEFAGDDPVVRDLNRALQPQQMVAMNIARSVAQHDERETDNPFQHDQLKKAYNSEKAFVQSMERRGKEGEGRTLEGEENVVEEVKERVAEIDPQSFADRTAAARARDREERERVEAERAEVDRLAGRAEGKRINIENLEEAAEERDVQNRTAAHAGKPVDVDTQRDAEREKNRQAELLQGIHREYRAAGNAFMYKDRPEKVAFRDRGTKLTTGVNDERVAFAMATMAEAKGWKTINVSGHPDFKREVWMEASLRGIKVKGFQPQEQDLADLKARQERGERNSVEEVRTQARQKAVERKEAQPSREAGAKPATRVQDDGERSSARNARDNQRLDKLKVVEAVAASVIEAKVKDPALRAELKAAIGERLAERTQAKQIPSVPVYDKNAPSKAKQVDRERPQVERNAERTR